MVPRINPSEGPPWRLALCITGLEPGGAEKCLTQLATRINRTLFQPVVYSLQPPPAADRQACVAELAKYDVPVHFLHAPRGHQLPPVCWQLRQQLRQHRPHVVQCFLFHANMLGTLAAQWAGVPVILGGMRVAERNKTWRGWCERALGSWVSRWVCVSQSVANFAQQRIGHPAAQLSVIPNGLNASLWATAAPASLVNLGISAERRCILFVGRLCPQKAVDRLLLAAAEFLPQLPQHDLLIVGTGEKRQALEHLAWRLGIRSRVVFAGWQADLPSLMQASDLMVSTSRWEGMPNSLLEAMAAGLPIVATEVEGVSELLGDSPSQLHPGFHPSQFAQQVVNILTNPDLAQFLSTSNQQRAQTVFSITDVIRCYEILYKQLIEHANGRPTARAT